MRVKALIIIMLSMGCGMGAALALTRTDDESRRQSSSTSGVKLFVAAVQVEEGELLTPRNLRLERRPLDRVPDGSISRLEDVQQRFAARRLLPGEPVLASDLRDLARIPSSSSHPAASATVPAAAGEPSGGMASMSHLLTPLVVRVSMSVHPAEAAVVAEGVGDWERSMEKAVEGWRAPTPSTVTGTFPLGAGWSLSSDSPRQPETFPANQLRLERTTLGEAFSPEAPRGTSRPALDFGPLFPVLE